MGRDSGIGDVRIPRGWERATRSPSQYRRNHERTFRAKDPLATNYCRKCKRTHSWCECSVAGNICKE